MIVSPSGNRSDSGSQPSQSQLQSLVLLGSAISGAVLAVGCQQIYNNYCSNNSNNKKQSQRKTKDPETDHSIGHTLVWDSIRGALSSAMIYVGDRLGLYVALRQMCSMPGSSVTAKSLAIETGLHQRWLREWLAQQAAMGVLQLLDGVGDTDDELQYRLPAATADVLANPKSKEYDVAMIHAVPSLVNRAKTMIPEAMKTGIGAPYNEIEVANAIDRQHAAHIRDIFIPQVLPKVLNGVLLERLQSGIHVCDLGCGAGGMLIALAQHFPNCTFHGFEISAVALQTATYNSHSAKLTNVYWHDANQQGQTLGDFPGQFDLAIVLDVLHDCTNPKDLIHQVKTALKPDHGVWLLADIAAAESIRANIQSVNKSETYFGFSLCLCMSCSLSEEGGAGLGTLGFSIPVAQKMLAEGGFDDVKVLLEQDNTRWFQVR